MTYDHDREVIVERDSGSGAAMILGILLAILIIAALLWWFGAFNFLGGGASATGAPGASLSLPSILPSK